MKNETKSNIGPKIKAAREKAGLSQEDLAKLLDFKTATAISLIENGERGVSAEMLKSLSGILHQDVQYFLGGEIRPMNLRIALRADKNITKKDEDDILRFVDFIKSKKNAK